MNDQKDEMEPQAPKSKKAPKPAPIEQLIYIGPNLSGGRLSQNTVFRGGTPAYMQDLLEQHPSIKDLIVPVAETAAAHAKTQLSGTPEYIAFQNLTSLRG